MIPRPKGRERFHFFRYFLTHLTNSLRIDESYQDRVNYGHLGEGEDSQTWYSWILRTTNRQKLFAWKKLTVETNLSD
jgi:hypothetical protein